MGVIQFRCSDALVARFDAAAARSGIKPSEFGRSILERVLSQLEARSGVGLNEKQDVKGDDCKRRLYERRTEKLETKLTPSEYRAVEEKATAVGMSTYMWNARLIRAHLLKQPQLGPDEMIVLREATYELNYIGRNLNQVAHALNMNPNAREKATRELIESVDSQVKSVCEAVKAVLDQNLNRWGF